MPSVTIISQPTTDRAMRTNDDAFLIDSKVGATLSLTKEGYLLCENVRVGRTGEMLYGAGEVPVPPGPDGIIRISRDNDALFRPETMASCNLKAAVNDHPPEDVVPANWKKYAIGTMTNPRRGEGIEDHYLFADLLITDEQAIKDVLGGKKEVSLGYDADYETLEPGKGRQHNIIVNHVALVDRGRCGPRCSIGDEAIMAKVTLDAIKTRILKAFKAKDAEGLTEALADMPTDDGLETGQTMNGLNVHLHTSEPTAASTGDEEEAPSWFNKFKESHDEAMNGFSEKMKGYDEFMMKAKPGSDSEMPNGEKDPSPAGTGDEDPDDKDKEGKAKDSAQFVTVFQDVMSRAEILCPGVKAPATFDAKAVPSSSKNVICRLQLAALRGAFKTEDGKALIGPMLAGRDLADDKLTRDTVNTIFMAASTAQKALNSAALLGSGRVVDTGTKAQPSLREINQRNAKFNGASA